MAQAIINAQNYDLYNFVGDPSTGTTRYIRDTQQTLAESSRTETTTHKKQFSFDLEYLTITELNNIKTAFALNTFSFTPLPYDTVAYTVKVISDGAVRTRPNTTAYVDIMGIVLEVA